MRTVTLNLSTPVIFDEVSKLTSYVGASFKTEDGSPIYDSFKLNKSDAPLIDKFYHEAINKITSTCNEYLTYLDANTGSLTVKLPDTFPAILEPELSESASKAVINLIFSLYCSTKGLEKVAGEYAELSALDLKEFEQRLYTRNKPTIPETHAT